MLLILVLIVVSVSAEPPTVKLPSGALISGTSSQSTRGGVSIDSFLGLQYATVTKRFEPAAAMDVADSPATIDATKFGPVCWQSSGVPDARMSENCLFVNVYRPTTQTNTAALLPVMVWVHGGGFNNGAGSDYDPSNLVASQEVVVVTINYRLGPFGFMMRDSSGAGGMLGISDQVLALQWVKQNIKAFGGDSDQVTLFGESAGSLSVCALIVTPSAQGLVHRAIMESGACTGIYWGPSSTPGGWVATLSHLKFVNAKSVQDLQDVTKFPPKAISSWNPYCFPPTCFGYSWGIDPGMLDGATSMIERYMLGKKGLNVEAVILGGNTYDGLAPWFYNTPILPQTQAQYDTILESNYAQYFPSLNQQEKEKHIDDIKTKYAVEKYSSYKEPIISSFIQYDGDFSIICPMKSLSAHLVSESIPTFTYVFGHLYGLDPSAQVGLVDVNGKGDSNTWASHTAEIFFVFGLDYGPDFANKSSGLIQLPFSKEEDELVNAVQSYWGEFAKQRLTSVGALVLDPPGFPEWKESSVLAGADKVDHSHPRNIMKFGASSGGGAGASAASAVMIEVYHDDECDAIGEFWPEKTTRAGVLPITWIVVLVVGIVVLLVVGSLIICNNRKKSTAAANGDALVALSSPFSKRRESKDVNYQVLN